MKTLSLLKAGSTATLLTALSVSTALLFVSTANGAQHMKEMRGSGNMDHSTMSMGAMKKAAPAKVGNLTVSGAWARQSFGKAANSAGFMLIKNTGTTDDKLIGVSSNISKKTELHTHIRDGQVMKMRRVKGGIAVPKGGSAELKPGGLHIMFIGLKEPLKAGTRFPVTLKFEKAGELTIELGAQKMAMPANMDKMNHGVTGENKMNRGSHQ